jgi:hypothetical protein
MSIEAHHRDSLLQTVRLELNRAHRGARAMEAGEIRRGLELALKALRDLMPDRPPEIPADALDKVQTALADLDAGALADMDKLIEDVRAAIA